VKPVRIRSVQEMIGELSSPVGVNLICLKDSSGVNRVVMETMLSAFGKNASSIFTREFDDVTMSYPGVVSPSLSDLKAILEWSKDLDDLVVCDSYGISAAPSVAFLIECTRRPPEEAVEILNPKTHAPNELIVTMGAGLGKDFVPDGIVEAYLIFLCKCREWFKNSCI
jgi:hypothetical protein